MFTHENTNGYTYEQLAALNEERDGRLSGLEYGSDEYNEADKAFSDEVARR